MIVAKRVDSNVMTAARDVCRLVNNCAMNSPQALVIRHAMVANHGIINKVMDTASKAGRDYTNDYFDMIDRAIETREARIDALKDIGFKKKDSLEDVIRERMIENGGRLNPMVAITGRQPLGPKFINSKNDYMDRIDKLEDKVDKIYDMLKEQENQNTLLHGNPARIIKDYDTMLHGNPAKMREASLGVEDGKFVVADDMDYCNARYQKNEGVEDGKFVVHNDDSKISLEDAVDSVKDFAKDVAKELGEKLNEYADNEPVKDDAMLTASMSDVEYDNSGDFGA